MPCCAFAAFIISQIVLGFGAIKQFVLRSERLTRRVAE